VVIDKFRQHYCCIDSQSLKYVLYPWLSIIGENNDASTMCIQSNRCVKESLVRDTLYYIGCKGTRRVLTKCQDVSKPSWPYCFNTTTYPTLTMSLRTQLMNSSKPEWKLN